MIDKILSLDTELFRLINHARSPFLDYVFAFFSAHWSIGLVLILFFIFLLREKGTKHWYLYILCIALCFLLADRISVICFKDVFCRLRPSHALDDAITVALKHFELVYDYKGGKYGFVSSHAANTFALITSLSLVVRGSKRENLFFCLMLFWGVVVGYSRVYCGFHYPLDVLCGAMLGVLIGVGVYYIYKVILKHL